MGITMKCYGGVPGNRGAPLFLPKGALTHHPEGAVVLPAITSLGQACALRGGYGSRGSHMDNATPLGRCCHCPRRRLYVLLPIKTVAPILETTRRLLAKICHWQFCRSYGYHF